MHDKQEVMKEVRDILCEVLDQDEVILTGETTAEDVEGWDSLENIEILLAIEERFSFKFTVEEAVGMKNIDAMLDIILEKGTF